MKKEISPHMRKVLDALPFTVPVPLEWTFEPENFKDTFPDSELATILGATRENFERALNLPIAAFLYARETPSGEMLNTVIASILTGTEPNAKDLWASFLRHFALNTKVLAVVHVSEAWHFHSTTPEELATLRAWQTAHDGSYEGCPGVGEVVSVRVEYNGTFTMWNASISREGSKACLGDWVCVHSDPVSSSTTKGRFVGILPLPANLV